MLQLAWLNGLTEFIMPYMVQTIKEMTGKVRHAASDLHPVLSHRLLIQAKPAHCLHSLFHCSPGRNITSSASLAAHHA